MTIINWHYLTTKSIFSRLFPNNNCKLYLHIILWKLKICSSAKTEETNQKCIQYPYISLFSCHRSALTFELFTFIKRVFLFNFWIRDVTLACGPYIYILIKYKMCTYIYHQFHDIISFVIHSLAKTCI